jgi:hypothetical protein
VVDADSILFGNRQIMLEAFESQQFNRGCFYSGFCTLFRKDRKTSCDY